MPKFQYRGQLPRQIDVSPGAKNRSCDGAIHLLPGNVYEVTKDEMEEILARKNIASDVLLLAVAEPPVQQPELPSTVAEQSSTLTSEASIEEEPVPKKKQKV